MKDNGCHTATVRGEEKKSRGWQKGGQIGDVCCSCRRIYYAVARRLLEAVGFSSCY